MRPLQVDNCRSGCWPPVPPPPKPSREGTWLLEAPAAAGGGGTKVHKGQPEWPAGKWAAVPPPVSGVCQRWAPIRASSSHTAKVGLTEAGSQYPVGVASSNLAGRPGHCVSGCRLGALRACLSLCSCGFDPLPAAAGTWSSKSRYSRVAKKKM